MTADYLLGIDAGTSVVKAALFDRHFREIAATSRRTQVNVPHPAWSETSMMETWATTLVTVRDLLAETGVKQVAGIGVTATMVGAWLIDENGNPVRPGILWSDGRTQSLIDRLSEENPGFMSTIFQHSGSVMQQGCTLPLLRWLADHEPETLARAQYVLTCKDWIVYKLTGSIQLDPTLASMMPGDTRSRTYSEAMIDLIDVRKQRHLLPPVKPSQEVVGTLLPDVAKSIGLRGTIPVIAGAGDVPAAAIGVGAVEPGVACTLLGTTCLNCLVTDKPVFEPVDLGLLFCQPENRWLRAMVNVAGTTNMDWFIDQFCAPELAESTSRGNMFMALERMAHTSPVGANGVIYLPYLSPVGIIAPVVNSAARAEFFGLTIEHRRADMLRAVYEGVALSIRDCYNVIPASLEEIRLSGGGAKSPFWSQMIADCTGRRTIVPDGSEFGARGAAVLAAVGNGWYQSVSEAVSAFDISVRMHEPNPAHNQQYDRIYGIYTELRNSLPGVWRKAVS